MNLGIVEVLTDDEVKKVTEDLYGTRSIWKQRTNWHPTNDIVNTEDLESFMHYSTLGATLYMDCLLYTSPSPRDKRQSRMPSSA